MTRENGRERDPFPRDGDPFPHAVLSDVCDLPSVLPRFFRDSRAEEPLSGRNNFV